MKHETITFNRSIEADRHAVVTYLESEIILNTHLLGDIYYYGFDNEATDT